MILILNIRNGITASDGYSVGLSIYERDPVKRYSLMIYLLEEEIIVRTSGYSILSLEDITLPQNLRK